jgi:hypothetical protein
MGRNSQYNFLVVVLEACKRQKLNRGHFFLVLDNAAIHSGIIDIVRLLRRILDFYGKFPGLS